MVTEKIGAQHLIREALLYVRQSSAHQVQHNRESDRLQYAMRERLMQLGWSTIEVIHDDLGCSAVRLADLLPAQCSLARDRIREGGGQSGPDVAVLRSVGHIRIGRTPRVIVGFFKAKTEEALPIEQTKTVDR